METNLQALLDISPDAVLVVDDKGRILECNGVLPSVLGYTREEVMGQRVEFLVPSRFRSAHERHRTTRVFPGDPVRVIGVTLRQAPPPIRWRFGKRRTRGSCASLVSASAMSYRATNAPKRAIMILRYALLS